MKLYYICSNCSSEHSLSSNAETRVQFAMKYWEQKQMICSTCGYDQITRVDDLFAKPSRFSQIVSLSILLIGTPILIYFCLNNNFNVYIIGGIFALPLLVYMGMHKQDKDRLRAFNLLKLKT